MLSERMMEEQQQQQQQQQEQVQLKKDRAPPPGLKRVLVRRKVTRAGASAPKDGSGAVDANDGAEQQNESKTGKSLLTKGAPTTP